MRRADKPDQSQQAIVSALRSFGHTVVIIGKPVDLLVKIPGKTNQWIFMECKTPNRKRKQGIRLRKDQQEQQEFCHWYGVPYISTPQEALDLIRSAK